MSKICVECVESTLYKRAVSGRSDTATIFFLKTRKPEVYGEKRLQASEIAEIRRETRREIIDRLATKVADLPEPTRSALVAALSQPNPDPDVVQLEAPKD